MQLAPPPTSGSVPTDVAAAVTAALSTRGPAPAVTVLHPSRREEQGVASLAQWAAKGAHLLEAELLLQPGDRLHVDVAPGWPLAAVCLAAWWAGITVTLPGAGGPAAEVAVVSEGRTAPPDAADVLWVGDGVDGGPLGTVDGEAWPVAVQAWPDAPPPPGAEADRMALRTGEVTRTQAELLAEGAAIGQGRLGVSVTDLDALTAVLAIAARPVATPHPTVLLAGTDRAAADGERVRTWWP